MDCCTFHRIALRDVLDTVDGLPRVEIIQSREVTGSQEEETRTWIACVQILHPYEEYPRSSYAMMYATASILTRDPLSLLVSAHLATDPLNIVDANEAWWGASTAIDNELERRNG